MAATISYESYVPDSVDAQTAIRFCVELADKHQWHHEGLDLHADPDNGTRIYGAFSFAGLDVESAAFIDLQTAINVLARAADEYKLTWRVNIEGSHSLITPEGPDEDTTKVLAGIEKLLTRTSTPRPPKWMPAERQRFSAKGKKALQTRWDQKQAESFLVELFSSGTVKAPPFGHTNDGRLDGRGIDLQAAIESEPNVFDKEWVGPVIRQVDWSFAQTWSLITRHQFERCVLDGIVATGYQFRGSYKSCSMRGVRLATEMGVNARLRDCDLSLARIGTDRWVGFDATRAVENCQFHFADLSKSTIRGMKFSDCEFLNANFNDVQLQGVQFINCLFDGSSFDNTFYAEVIMDTCRGFDLDRMDVHGHVMYGDKISGKEDIKVE